MTKTLFQAIIVIALVVISSIDDVAKNEGYKTDFYKVECGRDGCYFVEK